MRRLLGDVKTAGADLQNPRAELLASVDAIGTARDDLAEATQELADAQAALASVQSSASSGPAPTTSTTTLWTLELTAALMNFQNALGVPATGVVDAQTLAALETAIANAKTGSTSTTSPSPSTSSSSSGSSNSS